MREYSSQIVSFLLDWTAGMCKAKVAWTTSNARVMSLFLLLDDEKGREIFPFIPITRGKTMLETNERYGEHPVGILDVLPTSPGHPAVVINDVSNLRAPSSAGYTPFLHSMVSMSYNIPRL